MMRISVRRLLLLAATAAALSLRAADAPVSAARSAASDIIKSSETPDIIKADKIMVEANAAAGKYRVNPGPDDGRIASVTAGLMQQLHYSHRAFDDAVSSQFLDRYVESLDPQHLHF